MPARGSLTYLKLSYLGVAVADIEQALSAYQELLGYIVLSGPFNDPVQKVKVCFVGPEVPGDPIVEPVAPLGNNSPVIRILSNGGGAYHVCYEVDDIDQTLKDVRAKGCLVERKPVSVVAFVGRRIV